jgi:antitoxin component of MazEF toxin-antitoxin module
MVITKVRKWGSSLGVIIPKGIVEELNLTEDQDVAIDLKTTSNVLRDLFGSAARKNRKSTEEILMETRNELGID